MKQFRFIFFLMAMMAVCTACGGDDPIPTPEPTPETLGTFTILPRNMYIRKGPGTTYEQAGVAYSGQTYTAYESEEAGGYTWYRVGEDQWSGDNGYLLQFIETEDSGE